MPPLATGQDQEGTLAPIVCAHCELPTGRRVVRGIVADVALPFCCYGCVLAMQITRARGESGAAAALLVRLGVAVFFAMNAMMVTLPTYAPYVYGAAADPGEGALFHALRVLGLAFALPVLFLLGWPILLAAIANARSGALATDALIVLGTAAAYSLSAWHTYTGGGPIYYDTAAMLLVLVTLGRYLEARAKADAAASIRRVLAPAPALARRARGLVDEPVDPALLAAGDLVRVGAGEAFPADGVVLEGVGGADESTLTGESRPVAKDPGSAVAGGTCSIDGCFLVHLTAPVAASAAARIAALLDRARRERSTAERLADRAARAFVPVVMVLALGAGAWWSWRIDVDAGVLVALAVLAVACPCALGIATPVAAWIGLTTAGRHGVIARSAAVLERAGRVERVLFDKTGTLTGATPTLRAIQPASGSPFSADEILELASTLEADLQHPIARALRAVRADGGGHPRSAATDLRVIAGRGVRGCIDGAPLTVGSPRFAAEDLPAAAPEAHLSSATDTAVCVWRPDRLLGTLYFSERARPEAAPAIHALRALGLEVGLVTGDQSAAAVVPALFEARDAAVGLTPEGKLGAVRAARGRGPVAMVGDGLNDAPALAAADVGIAVGGATDLARISADIVIVGGGLDRVPWLIVHARRVARVMHQNLAWAFGYNAIAIVAAAAGLLNPIIATLAMVASSAAVLANARRLQGARPTSGWDPSRGWEAPPLGPSHGLMATAQMAAADGGLGRGT